MSIVAAAVTGRQICMCLEQADCLRFYDVDEGKIQQTRSEPAEQNLAKQIRRNGARVLLVGVPEDMSRRELAMAGITLYAGVFGDADMRIQELIENRLDSVPDTARPFRAVHYSPCGCVQTE